MPAVSDGAFALPALNPERALPVPVDEQRQLLEGEGDRKGEVGHLGLKGNNLAFQGDAR